VVVVQKVVWIFGVQLDRDRRFLRRLTLNRGETE